jgi:hypothetical protein
MHRTKTAVALAMLLGTSLPVTAATLPTAALGVQASQHARQVQPITPTLRTLMPSVSLPQLGLQASATEQRHPLVSFDAMRGALSAFRSQSASALDGAGKHIPLAWQKGTDLDRAVRSFKRNGLPLVHLWEGGPHLLAIGISPKGVPGLYLSQRE